VLCPLAQVPLNRPLNRLSGGRSCRENLDWLTRATNWAKFSATAGLGMIHRGHLSQGRALMEPYLPRGTSPSVSPYSEGGALYALGMIHVDHGEGIQQFLLGMWLPVACLGVVRAPLWMALWASGCRTSRCVGRLCTLQRSPWSISCARAASHSRSRSSHCCGQCAIDVIAPEGLRCERPCWFGLYSTALAAEDSAIGH
jgi:hypothetical protein